MENLGKTLVAVPFVSEVIGQLEDHDWTAD